MDQGIMTLATVAVVLVVVALALWMLYTVVWRAVRRGMREFSIQSAASRRMNSSVALVPDYPPQEWFEPATARRTPRRAPRGHP